MRTDGASAGYAYHTESYTEKYLQRLQGEFPYTIPEADEIRLLFNGGQKGVPDWGVCTWLTHQGDELTHAPLPENLMTFHKPTPQCRPDETLVMFSGFRLMTLSLQTAQMARDLRAFQSWPTRNSAVYTLMNDHSEPVLYVRISSQGVCSTRTVPSSMHLPDRLHFKFMQWLPDDVALPANPTSILVRHYLEGKIEADRMVEKLAMELKVMKITMSHLQNDLKGMKGRVQELEGGTPTQIPSSNLVPATPNSHIHGFGEGV